MSNQHLAERRRRAVSPEPLQQPVNLSAAQRQNIRRGHGGHPTLHHLAQNLDPVQFSFAHHHPSHVWLPRIDTMFIQGSVTFLNCRGETF